MYEIRSVAFLFLHRRDLTEEIIHTFISTFEYAFFVYVGQHVSWKLIEAIQYSSLENDFCREKYEGSKFLFAISMEQAIQNIVKWGIWLLLRFNSRMSWIQIACNLSLLTVKRYGFWSNLISRKLSLTLVRINNYCFFRKFLCILLFKKGSVVFCSIVWVRLSFWCEKGSLQEVMKADLQELRERVPLDKTTLEAIYTWFH